MFPACLAIALVALYNGIGMFINYASKETDETDSMEKEDSHMLLFHPKIITLVHPVFTGRKGAES